MAREADLMSVNIAKSFISAVADLSPGCKHASRLQSEALNHQLPARQRLGLKIHLMLCDWCRRYGKQTSMLRDATHQHPGEMIPPVPQSLSEEARERLKQRLNASAE